MMKWILGIVSVLIVIAAVALYVIPAQAPAPEPEYASLPNEIRVTSPAIGAPVSSPLVATGEARGWYFEASFPVELRNAAGQTIAQGYAEAQSDWMTAEFVPFKTIPLSFPPQTAGSQGTLILRNDNPSGLPENDRSIEISVIFQ